MNHRTEEIKDELVARQGEAGGDGRKVIDPQETIYAAARLDSNRAKKYGPSHYSRTRILKDH